MKGVSDGKSRAAQSVAKRCDRSLISLIEAESERGRELSAHSVEAGAFIARPSAGRGGVCFELDFVHRLSGRFRNIQLTGEVTHCAGLIELWARVNGVHFTCITHHTQHKSAHIAPSQTHTKRE
jgi:hypothetical protein